MVYLRYLCVYVCIVLYIHAYTHLTAIVIGYGIWPPILLDSLEFHDPGGPRARPALPGSRTTPRR